MILESARAIKIQRKAIAFTGRESTVQMGDDVRAAEADVIGWQIVEDAHQHGLVDPGLKGGAGRQSVVTKDAVQGQVAVKTMQTLLHMHGVEEGRPEGKP